MIFVDTSAFYACLCASDLNHAAAASAWKQILDTGEPMITSNYAALETSALLRHRLGLDAVKTFHEDCLPFLEVIWVDAATHRAALSALFMAVRRQVSLVDCVSFEVMRANHIRKVFTFDRHFKALGFEALP